MQVFLAIPVSTNFGDVECSCLGGSSVWKWGVTVPSHVLTAILGMHTLMSNQQYYQALGSSSIVNKEGLNSEYRALTARPRHPAPAPQRGHLRSEAVLMLLASSAHSGSLPHGRV